MSADPCPVVTLPVRKSPRAPRDQSFVDKAKEINRLLLAQKRLHGAGPGPSLAMVLVVAEVEQAPQGLTASELGRRLAISRQGAKKAAELAVSHGLLMATEDGQMRVYTRNSVTGKGVTELRAEGNSVTGGRNLVTGSPRARARSSKSFISSKRDTTNDVANEVATAKEVVRSNELQSKERYSLTSFENTAAPQAAPRDSRTFPQKPAGKLGTKMSAEERARGNLLFEALYAAWYGVPYRKGVAIVQDARGRLTRAAKQLLAVEEITPQRIEQFARDWNQKWPDTPCSPQTVTGGIDAWMARNAKAKDPQPVGGVWCLN